MKGIVIGRNGELDWSNVEKPVPKKGEVLIKVAATAVNRADLLQRAGVYPPPPGASHVPGLECSGVVSAVGEGVTSVTVGQDVCALLSGGGYAQYACCPATQVLPLPAGLSFAEAAALPEVFITAYLNVFIEGGLSPGETALIHAGASGVGTAAIQLCRLFNNRVFVTVGGKEKVKYCTEVMGATGAVDRHDGDWVESLRKLTSEPINVILDPVGGQYTANGIELLAVKGRLVLIGLMSGHMTPPISILSLLRKRCRLIGSILRARSVEEKAVIIEQVREKVWPEFKKGGQLEPVIDYIMPMERILDAYELIESNKTKGKVVLTISHEDE